MVASLQDLKFEMLPANIQQALSGFGIKSTADMRAMYEKYKDSPGMLNMGMQALGLTPAAVDAIVAQAGAKQQAAAASTPTSAAASPPPARAAASVPARAPARAAPALAPQPKAVAPQVAPQQQAQQPDTETDTPDVEPTPQPPVATPDGEEDVNTQTDPSVNNAAVEEVVAPAEPEAVGTEDELPTAIEPTTDVDGSGVDATADVDAAQSTAALSDQDAAIEQLIANGRDGGVSGADQTGAGAMAGRPMPRGAGKSAARGGAKQQAMMDDIVSQMMAQNAMQQSAGPQMPNAQPQVQMPPRANRPPPPIAQKSQRSEQMIANLVRGAKGQQEAQSKKGAPTGRK